MNTANHCIREYIFVFATLYSRYESYSSLGVFVPALVNIHVIWECTSKRRLSKIKLTKDIEVVELLSLASLVRRPTGISSGMLHLSAIYEQPPAVVENEDFGGVAVYRPVLLVPCDVGNRDTRGGAGEGDGFVDYDVRVGHNVRVLDARRYCKERQDIIDGI